MTAVAGGDIVSGGVVALVPGSGDPGVSQLMGNVLVGVVALVDKSGDPRVSQSLGNVSLLGNFVDQSDCRHGLVPTLCSKNWT
jgi:hypothetical protein